MADKKEFYIRVKDELVEVTREVYLTYYRGKRGEETQLEKIRRNHVVSYDAFDTESALGAEMLIDTASDGLCLKNCTTASQSSQRMSGSSFICFSSMDTVNGKPP